MANSKHGSSVAKDAVTRRLYARGRWKLCSAAHFGGDDIGIADMCLVRAADGLSFIPAASIAGAVRSFLAKQSLPWAQYKNGISNESSALGRMFGGSDKEDTMSAVTVADAHSHGALKSIRDGVRVDAETGSAASKAKFDVEVVERGTEFELSLECVVRAGDPNDDMEQLFLALLHGFESGDIRLGARTRRGYGRGKVTSWEIRDLRMNAEADVLTWLRGDVWSRPTSTLTPMPLPRSKRQYFRIEVEFALRTSLLIRSSTVEPDAPDMAHLHSAGEPVVPGTSFAGAFRHRAALVANALGWTRDALDEVFGPIHEQRPPTGSAKGLWASRLSIEERLVQNVDLRRQHRVAIDRFTGGALPHALFDEEPVVGTGDAPHLSLELTLEEPDDAEIGLLLLTLRDFWHGNAALGGETSIGRGVLKGVEARLCLTRPASSTGTRKWKLSDIGDRMTVDGGDGSFFMCCVKKAQVAPDRPCGSRRPVEKGTAIDG